MLFRSDVSRNALSGRFVDNGEVLLDACRTDWRKWNKRAEELKTASVLRSENECPEATAVFVRYPGKTSDMYVSTLTEFANSEKGFNTLSRLLGNAGVQCRQREIDANDVFFHRDGKVMLPASAKEHFAKNGGDMAELVFYAYSPRPLDDLLIEPNVPKLSFEVKSKKAELAVNDRPVAVKQALNEARFHELPLKSGWNKITVKVRRDDLNNDFYGFFYCDNRADFMPLLNAAYVNPESR